MATSAGFDAARLPGDLGFLAGGLDVKHLIGAFVKSVAADGSSITVQNEDGTESTVALSSSPGGALADNSLLPAKARANTAAHKAEWRTRLGSSQISAGTTLPDLATVNNGDIRLITQPVPSGLSFVDISDSDTVLTAADTTDLMMAITLRSKVWVRIGNIFAARQARDEVQRIAPRVAEIERETADLDIVSDGPGLIDAPATAAGIAIFAAGTTIGDGLLNGTRDLMAADIASYSWQQTVGLGTTEQAIIVRIEGTLGPLDFTLEVGSEQRAIHSYRKVLSDSTWDYYYVGRAASQRLTIKRRGNVTHTRYYGELAGRALGQLETAIEDHEPDPSVTVDPPVWGLDASARTFLVTIHDLRLTSALADVDKIRLDLGGSLFVTHNWNPRFGGRVVAFLAPAGTGVTNITNNSSLGGTVRGSVTLHATAGGAVNTANERLRMPVALSVVAPEDVPTPGGQTSLVEHPRVFHANANLTADPNDNTRFSVDFSPNESGLVPVPNSLFTFLWNHAAGRDIYRATMSLRGTPSADATVILLSGRDLATPVNDTGDLTQGTTYVARYTGASVVVLTKFHDVRELPEYPAEGSRDGRIPKFEGDNLAWAEDEAGSGGGGSRSGGGNNRSLILQAAVAGADDAGVTTVTLPSDYATYRYLSIVAWRVSNDRTAPLDIPVPYLAAQTEIREIYLDFLIATWNPTARTMSMGSNRLLYAELHDGGPDSNLLIDSPAAPIAASALNLDNVLYRAKRLYRNEVLHYADPVATYRDFAATDLPTGYTWGGAVVASPSASAQPDNRIIYSIPGGHFLRKITGGGQSWWVAYTPPHWRGAVANQSAADHAIQAVGDVVFFAGKVQVAATYTPRTPDQFQWVPMEKRRFEVALGASPVVVPEGTTDIVGNMTKTGRQGKFLFAVPIMDIGTTAEDFHIDSRLPTEPPTDSKSAGIRLSYAPTTRTLTYLPLPQGAAHNQDGVPGIIGSIRARGEA